MKNSLLLFFLLAIGIAKAQVPPGIDWQQINSDNFDVIFPKEIATDAQRVTNTLEAMYEPVSKTLGRKPKRLTLVLNNQGAMANGYVTPLPRHSEWYTTPWSGSDLGTGEWLELLSIHEYRHVAQLDRNNVGFTRLANFLTGDYGLILSFWSVPGWYWEGDAVGTETALSLSGRGRLPSFDMHIRTLLLNDKLYAYEKAGARSFRDFYPDHYKLGYLITSHVKRNYPTDTWEKILQRTAKISFWPFFFSPSMKHVTGYNARNTYKRAMHELDSLWTLQADALTITDATKINTRVKKSYTNYRTPFFDKNGNIITLRTGMSHIPVIIKVDAQGNETVIAETDADEINVSGGKVTWTTFGYNARWNDRNYSDVVVMDLQTGTKRQITSHGRLFSPALSPQGNQVAVIEYSFDHSCRLLILDAQTGKETFRYSMPQNDYLRNPAWSPDGSKIVFLHSRFDGLAMSVITIATKEVENLLPYSWEAISNPTFAGNYILYNSAYTGIDNIFAIETSTKQRFQVTSRKYGAFNAQPSSDGSKIVYSDYNLMGHDLAVTVLNPSSWTTWDNVKVDRVDYFESYVASETPNALKSTTISQTKEHEIKPYKGLSRAFHFHSWMWYPTLTDWQLFFQSDNYLKTVSSQVGIKQNLNNQKLGAFGNISYSALYPTLGLQFESGYKTMAYATSDSTNLIDDWKENNVSFSVGIPLFWQRGLWYKQINATITAGYTAITGKDSTTVQMKNENGNMMPLSAELSLINQKQSAWRDIYPRLSQEIQLAYSSTPFGGDYKGNQISAYVKVNLPGLVPHHSLRVSAAMEMNQFGASTNYLFDSRLKFIRGYEPVAHEQLTMFTADYALPLVYPDIAFPTLFVLKRIRTNVFFDYGIGTDTGYPEEMYASTGIDLIFDSGIAKSPVNIDVGVRYNNPLIKNSNAQTTPSFAMLLFGLDVPLKF